MEQQYHDNEISMSFSKNLFSNALKKLEDKVVAPIRKKPNIIAMGYNKPKVKYEYSEMCKELAPIYGKRIWTLPRKIGFTEYKIKKAHEIAQSKGRRDIKYLIGIINKLV